MHDRLAIITIIFKIKYLNIAQNEGDNSNFCHDWANLDLVSCSIVRLSLARVEVSVSSVLVKEVAVRKIL